MSGVYILWVLTALAGLIGVLIVWLQRHPAKMRPLMKTFGEKGDISAQHAPRPPLWRRVFSLPRTRLGWWAVGLASPVLLAMTKVLMAFILGVGGVSLGEGVAGALVGITLLVSALAGGLVGFIALARDQSLLVWAAQVPALCIFAVFASFGVESGLWFIPSVVVFLLWAILAFGIIWSYRDLSERRS